MCEKLLLLTMSLLAITSNISGFDVTFQPTQVVYTSYNYNAQLECDGYPDVQIDNWNVEWWFKGAEVDERHVFTQTAIVGNGGGFKSTYVIYGVRKQDIGTYHVYVSNPDNLKDFARASVQLSLV